MPDAPGDVAADTAVQPPAAGLEPTPLADAPASLTSSSDQLPDALYELTQSDVSTLLSFAATLTTELYIIIALLLIIAGLIFGNIATKFWKVG